MNHYKNAMRFIGLILMMVAGSLSAATYTWTQVNAGTHAWVNDANWSGTAPAPTSGDTIDFSTVNIGDITLTLGADRTATTWLFGDTSGANTWTVNSGNQMVLAGASPTINNSVQLTFNNVLSGSAGLAKSGAGTMILSGDNTFTGDITVNGGQMWVGNGNSGSLGGGNYSGNIQLASGTVLNVKRTSDQTLSGVISGGGSLNKAYGGQLILSGSNTYTGASSVAPQTTAGGTLVVTSLNSVNGGIPLLPASSLGCPTTVVDGTITIGSVTQSGPGLRYVGPGETTDRVIKLHFNSSGTRTLDASGSGLLKFTSPLQVIASSGTLAGGLRLRGTGEGEITAGVPIMPGRVIKQDSGTWTISGESTYAVEFQISSGTLIARGTNTLGVGDVIVNGGTLVLEGDYSLADTNRLTINSGTVELSQGVRDKIDTLWFGATQQVAGVWGSAISRARNKSASFTGPGTLFVGVDFPPNGTVIMLK